MVLHNPGNWHWVDKNCLPWSKEYFGRTLLVSAESAPTSAKVSKVISVEGDCDVCQRKGKVIGLYDMSLSLEVTGSTGSGDEATAVKGKIQIPEVMYNTEEDEFVFNISLENESSATEPVKTLIKKELVPKLRAALLKYGEDLIAENGTTIQHPDKAEAAKKEKVEFARPASTATTSSTAQIRLSPTFTASAEQLFDALTVPEMVAAWSRSAPSGDGKPGSKLSLFGGNVTGEYVTVDKPTKLVQKWRLKDWKEGVYSTVNFAFTQDRGVTTLDVTWSGIPVGQEDVVRTNFKNYYVHPIMLTFGFGVPS